MTPPPRRKLIEVSLPLEKINAESAREKSIRHGHPASLHVWWSRKPLATARAVLFAQLVDDPSCRPEALAMEDEAEREAWITAERERLHRLIEELVVWENTTDEALFARAHAEILRDTDGNPPPVLDPFAGGGSIPLEAQRLGLEARASDLNPVAVLINKALIEIPPKFAGRPPVFPGAAESRLGDWQRATGLAEDVRRYGRWMRDEAEKRIGHLYPKAKLPDGTRAPVVAWIWARTVTCPNPACGIAMPLTSKWYLGKKKGKEAFLIPVVDNRRVRFEIGHGQGPDNDNGTVGRNGAICVACATPVPLSYIRTEGRNGLVQAQLIAIVAAGKRGRIYLPATSEHENAMPAEPVEPKAHGAIPKNSRDFKTPGYGMVDFAQLFTSHQASAMNVFVDLLGEVGASMQRMAIGQSREGPGGTMPEPSAAYGAAVLTYLGLAISKLAEYQSSACSWASNPKNELVRNVFARQAITMAWDYADSNVFSDRSGSFLSMVEGIARSVERLPAGARGLSEQMPAQSVDYHGAVSTDPPYYFSVNYAELSDFFYVWLRQLLGDVHVDLLSTLLTPKADELVASPFRHGTKRDADIFFQRGFESVFSQMRKTAHDDIPVSVYYAVKQTDSDEDGAVSQGWEAVLTSITHSGWRITATWPVRSELTNRLLASGKNALASSIVLALRPRPTGAPSTDRRGLLAALRAELPDALRELQQGAIAPVDLPQAAIGPGMAVFTRYAAVLGNDGTPMTVREALQQINHLLDEVLSEQEGDFDPDTRFLLTWFKQHGFAAGPFGDADNLARARNASVERLKRSGALTSHRNEVTIIAPADLPADWDPATDPHLTVWEVVLHLARVLAADGVPAAAALYRAVPSSLDLVLAKELTSLLFRYSEQRKDSGTAQLFNALGSSWNEIAKAATGRSIPAAGQLEFPDTDDED